MPDEQGVTSTWFRERARLSFAEGSKGAASLSLGKHANVYNAGDRADCLYVVISGQVKLVTLSALGKECLLAILTPGHVFGELCLKSSHRQRIDTATTMEPTAIRVLTVSRFLAWLSYEGLHEAFFEYLVERMVQQQQIITSLVTVDSEHRLGDALLMLGRTLGRPEGPGVEIEARISHEELSQMIGTTRARVTTFMSRFRSLGLIDVSPARRLIVKEAKLTAYLESHTQSRVHDVQL